MKNIKITLMYAILLVFILTGCGTSVDKETSLKSVDNLFEKTVHAEGLDLEEKKDKEKEDGINRIGKNKFSKTNITKKEYKVEPKKEVAAESSKNDKSTKVESKKEIAKKPEVQEKKEIKSEIEKKKENIKKKESDSNIERNEVKKEKMVKKPSNDFKTENKSGDFMSSVELNMRKGPGTEYDAVGVLKPGVKAVASKQAKASNGSTWYEITVNNVTGWSSSNYLSNYAKTETKQTNSSTANKQVTSDSAPKYNANTIYWQGNATPYKNGGRANGQKIIDTSSNASTWGGAETFSGNDGLNTHFIGHSPGNFTGIQNTKQFTITDGNGAPFHYSVMKVYKVDGNGIGTDGTDHLERITGTGGGERITIQTCEIGTNLNWIIEASPK